MPKSDLKSSLDEAEWEWLKPHVLRDAVIVIGDELKILDVATEIANNNSALIKEWINRKLIAKPSAEQIKDWDQSPETRFYSIIVQPYVLIQKINVKRNYH